MGKDQLMGVIRHLITSGAGVAATMGYMQDSDVQQVVGAVMLLAGIVWSAMQKASKAP